MSGLNPNAKSFSFGDDSSKKQSQPQYNQPEQRQLFNPYQQQQTPHQYYNQQQPLYNTHSQPQYTDPNLVTQQQRAAIAAERNKAFEQASKPVQRIERPNMPLPGQSTTTQQSSRPIRANLPLPGESIHSTAPNGVVEESADGSWEDLADDTTTNQTSTSQSQQKSTNMQSNSTSTSSAAPVIALTSNNSGNNTPRSNTPINGIDDKMKQLNVNTTANNSNNTQMNDHADIDADELTDAERAELADMDGVSIDEIKKLEKEAADAKAQALKQASTQNKKLNIDENRPRVSAVSDAASTLQSHDNREHINIVFIGHVDAGKSTISGQIMLLTNQVDERTMQKYEKEAKEKNRESWYLAYIMDTNEEERAKGKTVEVGRAHFNTEKKRFTLLDAPGHKNYVPNMIGGAQQADIGVLVISARKGEFEAGFERGGQTREHAQLAKTLGLQKLIVLVNKMDDSSVLWSQSRYNEIYQLLSKFLQQWGFKSADVIFIPCSGYTGANLKQPVSSDICPWYTAGKSFFDVLDSLPPLTRDSAAPLRLPIISKFKDMGSVYAVGKIESGTLVKNSNIVMVPTMNTIQCTGISIDEVDVDVAKTGENVLVKLKGIEEEDVMSGYVLSYPDHPCRSAVAFDCQVQIMELLEHKPVLAAGYQCILHVHSTQVECYVSGIIAGIDKKTGKNVPKRPKFAKDYDIVVMRLKCEQSIAIESFAQFPQLGRFTLRDEGKTIGIGRVLKLVE